MTPQRSPGPISGHSCLSCPQPLSITSLVPVSVDLPILDMPFEKNRTCGLLCLASFTEHQDFKVDPQCSLNQYIAPFYCQIVFHRMGLPWWLRGKEPACGAGDWGSIPGSGRSPGGRHDNPLQYSCLENPTDRGAWQAAVHRIRHSSATKKPSPHSAIWRGHTVGVHQLLMDIRAVSTSWQSQTRSKDLAQPLNKHQSLQGQRSHSASDQAS